MIAKLWRLLLQAVLAENENPRADILAIVSVTWWQRAPTRCPRFTAEASPVILRGICTEYFLAARIVILFSIEQHSLYHQDSTIVVTRELDHESYH